MEIEKGDMVVIKGEPIEFEVLGVKDGVAYLMNDDLMETGVGLGIYEKLENLLKL